MTSTGEELLAINEVSFEVPDQEFVSIVGPSGCGKTTLLEIVANLRHPTTGEVLLDGNPVSDPDVQRNIGIVFQEDTLLPWRTIVSNVAFGLETRGVGKSERLETAHRMLAVMGLEGFEDAYAAELSGGMRQRVALARTLVMKPKLLLLDEPFGALDAQTRLVLGTEVGALVERESITVLLVTHSIEEAAMLSDQIIVLSARPGSVRAIVKGGLPKPRGLQSIGTDELADIEGEVWGHMRHEVVSSSQQTPA